MSFASDTLHLLETANLPSRKVCGLCWREQRLADNKSAKSMNWPPVILDVSLAEMGARPGPITKALSKEGEVTELSKPVYMLVTWVALRGEVNAAVRQDELELVVASPGGVLPYMGHIGMCRCEGYGFQAVYSSIGYVNQSVWV